MRKSSRKTMKRTLPKLPLAVVFFCIMAVLAFLVKGSLSDDQPDIQSGERAGNNLNPSGDVSRHRNVLDRGYRELAVSFMMKSLYARPLEIKDIGKTTGFLAENLGLDEKKLGRELKLERSFFWLGRRLPESRADAILVEEIQGIYAVEEAQRFYPARRSASHVIGFVEENSGLAGVEFSYDHLLRRSSGVMAVESEIPDGHLQLTLDLQIQELLESELGRVLKETSAPSGTGTVMNMKTGAILAMVSFPDYDPNYYWDSSSAGRRNRAVNGSIDVGGFNYLFGQAAAYEDAQNHSQNKLASLKMELLVDSLPKRSRGTKWFKQFGDNLLSPELRIWGEEAFAVGERAAFSEKIGLSRETGIDLPENNDSDLLQPGQTTPIRLLTAFAALVNGGTGITPHLGDAIIEAHSGRRTAIDHPAKQGLVTPPTSKKIIESLRDASRSETEAVFMESLRAVEVPLEDGVVDKQSDSITETRYQTVMIGFTPHSEAGLAILLALDGAVVDLNNKTVIRSMGEAVMDQALRLVEEKVESPSPEVMRANEKLIYEDWLKSKVVKKKDREVVVDFVGQGVMPDLKGLSLRKALRNLQRFAVKVRVVGSGQVVAQEPKAGSSFSGGECLLMLLTDN